jgi:hypothetical protein
MLTWDPHGFYRSPEGDILRNGTAVEINLAGAWIPGRVEFSPVKADFLIRLKSGRDGYALVTIQPAMLVRLAAHPA